jgi:hypothetical protein
MYVISEEDKSIQIFGRETCGESHIDDKRRWKDNFNPLSKETAIT